MTKTAAEAITTFAKMATLERQISSQAHDAYRDRESSERLARMSRVCALLALSGLSATLQYAVLKYTVDSYREAITRSKGVEFGDVRVRSRCADAANYIERRVLPFFSWGV